MKTFFKITLIALLCFGSLNLAIGQTTLINYGSSWSYYDLQNEPTDQGSFDWNDISYDSSSWSSGNTHMGYGDGDEVTVVNSNTYTLYVRHSFTVSNPSQFDSLNLNLTFDDGAVVYLNGVEVWRQNMPAGTPSYNTFSSSVGTENGSASTTIVNSLVTGTNVLSVEIHQASSSSSDISFDFQLSANAPGSVNVNRGPYLQKGTSNSMVVRWRTATPTETIIDYGTSLGSLSSNYSDLTLKTEHEVELTGLNSNTVYYYEISNNAAVLIPESSDMYFKTHPVIGSTQPVTFWALGDAGTANSDQRAVRDAYYNYIGSNVTDGILFLGDNAYNDGTDAQYQNAVFQNMYEDKLKNSVAWSTLGNHDGYTADSNSQTGPYYDIFTFPTNGESGGLASGTEAYYSFDYANIHFIVLESYETDRSIGGAMYNWAQNDIQNTTQQWIVAMWHHPPYTKGSHDSDTESNLIQMRQNFLPMLESNGVDLVLSGHSHSYERSYFLNNHYGASNTFNSGSMTVGANGSGDGKVDGNGAYVKSPSSPDGAVYITAGSSGKISGGSLDHNAMYASLNQLGSCILEVDGNTLNLKFIRETGVIADYFTIQKGCDVGTSCDDGDDCTTNDVYDETCNCVGTPEPDTDNDGVCDAQDLEIDSPCPLDVDSNGVSNDSDNDGVVNCLDSEPNSPCPNNVDANGISIDSDGDGVCDDNDICPGGNDNVDTDGDGIPDFCDNSNCLPDTTNFNTSNLSHSGSGSSNTFATIPTDGQDISFTISGLDQRTGGKPSNRYIEAVTISYVNEQGNNQTYGTFNAGSGSSVNVSISGIVQSLNVSLFDAYDGNSSTNMSVILSNVDFCVVSIVCNDSDGDGVCDPNDQCPDFDDNIDTDNDGIADGCDPCNDLVDTDSDGVSDCIDQEINSPCPSTVDANGVSIDSDNDGVCDELDQCPGSDDNLDSDNDGIPDGCDSCDNNLIGSACDDGDACTENDVYDANCDCVGTLTQDTDGDGVCDAEDQEINSPCPNTVDENGVTLDSDNDGVCDDLDQCPGFDDALIGTSCDDDDACTINDVYDSNCGCVGIPVADNDGDGYCSTVDPNDNDPCVPDTNSPTCNNCAPNSATFPNSPLTHSGGGSSTTILSLPANSQDVSFTISSINSKQNGKQNQRFIDRVVVTYVNGSGSNQTYGTFLGTNSSSVNVSISGDVQSITVALNDAYDGNAGITMSVNISQVSFCTIGGAAKMAYSKDLVNPIDILIYPNPAKDMVFVESTDFKDTNMQMALYNIYGQQVKRLDLKNANDGIIQMDVSDLAEGMYLLRLADSENNLIKTKRIIIKK
ncbi:metallophosphoesterase [Hanstruepera ponticola]|uniref:metallophosphoesterase n=1 Tax=Hanstruepera ponticola TaxID=2042995 RepID=UPI000CF07FB7|nr:metallophosphoesterase [Hanstruepera ponticola]